MKDSWKQFFLGAVAAVVLFAVGAGVFFLVRRDNGRFVEVQHYAGRLVTETIVQDRETGVYYLMIPACFFSALVHQESYNSTFLTSTRKWVQGAEDYVNHTYTHLFCRIHPIGRCV